MEPGDRILQQLNLLAGFDLAGMGHNTAEYIHTIVECAKLAFADREAYYGDPLVEDVPVDGLLDSAYARERRALVGDRASPELGFPLGTRAQMFWLERDLPNSLRGNKRPRTTLTPSLAFKHGEPYLAFGTPGGDSQDQWTLNFWLNHVHFGLDLQAAIDAPIWHTTHFPSSFYPRESHPGEVVVEGRLGESVVSELEERGHRVVVEEDCPRPSERRGRGSRYGNAQGCSQPARNAGVCHWPVVRRRSSLTAGRVSGETTGLEGV